MFGSLHVFFAVYDGKRWIFLLLRKYERKRSLSGMQWTILEDSILEVFFLHGAYIHQRL